MPFASGKTPAYISAFRPGRIPYPTNDLLSKNTMKNKITYTEKFKTFHGKTFYENLTPDERQYIKHISYALQFTFQEFRQVVEA
jgi:hypothetical protein